MASNSSGSLRLSQPYSLGDYALTLSAQYDSYEQQTHVITRCVKGTDAAQSGKDLNGNRQIPSWRVEAEDKTATVYATEHIEPLDISPVLKPVAKDISAYLVYSGGSIKSYEAVTGSGLVTNAWTDSNSVQTIFASVSQNVRYKGSYSSGGTESFYDLTRTYTHGGKTVYYQVNDEIPFMQSFTEIYPIVNNGQRIHYLDIAVVGRIAWSMVYEEQVGDSEFIVTKFQIDIANAGGNTWDYPGDVGEPSKTLHITVTGALSGRHNDPLNDTTYHYTPSDREQSEVYGSGGIGGSGGAGGAGASTVIIYNCATDKAGYTEEIAIARRHGYGSGAGKGGKGGDGCILVYY